MLEPVLDLVIQVAERWVTYCNSKGRSSCRFDSCYESSQRYIIYLQKLYTAKHQNQYSHNGVTVNVPPPPKTKIAPSHIS